MGQIAPHCWDLAGFALPGESRPFPWDLKSSLGSLSCCPSKERFLGGLLCFQWFWGEEFSFSGAAWAGNCVFCCLSPVYREIWEGGNILGVLPKPLTQLLQKEKLEMKEFYWKLGTSGAPLQEQAAPKPSWQRDVHSHKGLGPKNHPRFCGDCVVFIKPLFMDSWGRDRDVRAGTWAQSRSFGNGVGEKRGSPSWAVSGEKTGLAEGPRRAES